MPRGSSYLDATRHPWACVLFVLPLLTAYEVGVLLMGSSGPPPRSGADIWLRGLLDSLGFGAGFAAPVLLASYLLLWSCWRRADRPREYFNVWTGMLVESALFAIGLFVLSQAFLPLLDGLDIFLQSGPTPASTSQQLDPTGARLLNYLGAGIYEETLFRLLLFTGLAHLFFLAELPLWAGLHLAALLSALVFAGAHHLGPYGESFHPMIFLFRTASGLYFAWLCRLRGFGITVGAHTGYDLLAGLGL